MLKLIVESGFPRGKDYTLDEGETIVGRAPECGIRLTAMDVSRSHTRITVTGGRATAENLSSHGTLLDGQALSSATVLTDGQRLSLGVATVLLFRKVPDESNTSGEALLAQTQASEETVAEPLPPPTPEPIQPAPDPKPAPAPEPESPLPAPTPESELEMEWESEPAIPSPDPEPTPSAPADAFEDLVSSENAVVPIQVASEEPETGPKVDVVARADIPEEDFDFVSQESVRPGQIISKDEGFEPVGDDFVQHPEAWASAPEEEGGHTQPMNPEAVKFLRQIQEKRARNRRIMIIAAVVAGLLALAGLIVWL